MLKSSSPPLVAKVMSFWCCYKPADVGQLLDFIYSGSGVLEYKNNVYSLTEQFWFYLLSHIMFMYYVLHSPCI